MKLGNPNFPLTWLERVQSTRHRLFFALREKIRWTRPGYTERGQKEDWQQWLESLDVEARTVVDAYINNFNFTWQNQFFPLTAQFSLATIYTLAQFSFPDRKGKQNLAEWGSQDFRRAPGLRSFFPAAYLHGFEIDAFQWLPNLHSRFDLGQYFATQVGQAEYASQDAFDPSFRQKFDGQLVFYPFVSPHPALAWGLPAELGSPEAWVQSLAQRGKKDSWCFVLHQGPWEEEEWLEALAKNPVLSPLERKIVSCPFWPTPHPPHASLYRVLGS